MDIQERIRRFETDSKWIEVELPVDPADEPKESVLVEKLSADRFRIVSTPGFVENLATDDVISLDSDRSQGYRLLTRGGNLAVRFVLASRFCPRDRHEAQEFLDQELTRHRGRLDGFMGERGLTYTVPVSAGFDAVEAIMGSAVVRFSDSTWWHGNVYDDADQPLNWWHREGASEPVNESDSTGVAGE